MLGCLSGVVVFNLIFDKVSDIKVQETVGTTESCYTALCGYATRDIDGFRLTTPEAAELAREITVFFKVFLS